MSSSVDLSTSQAQQTSMTAVNQEFFASPTFKKNEFQLLGSLMTQMANAIHDANAQNPYATGLNG